MMYGDYATGSNDATVSQIAKGFNLNLANLKVEFFSPGHQGIFVEKVGSYTFRIHINIEEDRIISVEQLEGPPQLNGNQDPFSKYKVFMK